MTENAENNNKNQGQENTTLQVTQHYDVKFAQPKPGVVLELNSGVIVWNADEEDYEKICSLLHLDAQGREIGIVVFFSSMNGKMSFSIEGIVNGADLLYDDPLQELNEEQIEELMIPWIPSKITITEEEYEELYSNIKDFLQLTNPDKEIVQDIFE